MINGFSLWLEPKNADLARIQPIFAKFQQQTNRVRFVPHVTLIGNIPLPPDEIRRRLGELIKETAKFRIFFATAATSTAYYKSLFLECEENSALTDLNRLAQKMYGLNSEYLPHMSVIYGATGNDLKEQIMAELNKDIGLFSFEVTAISLWHTHGTADQWEKLDEKHF